MTKPTAAAVNAWTGLILAQRTAQTLIEADLKAAGFPPLSWYDALLELRRAEPAGLRPFELQRRMLLAQYNMSRLADRLDQAGHLEKRPLSEDGRGHVLRITSSGRRLLKRMWPVYGDAISRHVGSRLTKKEAEQLASLLSAFSK